jgi:hypothetical protein
MADGTKPKEIEHGLVCNFLLPKVAKFPALVVITTLFVTGFLYF